MEKYQEMKNRHQKEFGELPIFFAFNNEQFKEGMEKSGLNVEDTNLIFKLPGGGFYKREDSSLIKEWYTRTEQEFENAISEDTTGEGFILEMFDYELSNHEYCITGDLEETLRVTGFTFEEVENNPALKNGLLKAIKNQNNY